MHLLLVEDNDNDAMILQRAIAKSCPDASVHRCSDGRDAILYLKRYGRYTDVQKYPTPSLVILDLKMPLVNGLEVLEFIRSTTSLSPLPVIVLTDSIYQSDLEKAYDLHANSFLAKSPLMALPEILSFTLKFWLNQNQLPNLIPPNSEE